MTYNTLTTARADSIQYSDEIEARVVACLQASATALGIGTAQIQRQNIAIPADYPAIIVRVIGWEDDGVEYGRQLMRYKIAIAIYNQDLDGEAYEDSEKTADMVMEILRLNPTLDGYAKTIDFEEGVYGRLRGGTTSALTEEANYPLHAVRIMFAVVMSVPYQSATDDTDAAVDLGNQYAPEHVAFCVGDPGTTDGFSQSKANAPALANEITGLLDVEIRKDEEFILSTKRQYTWRGYQSNSDKSFFIDATFEMNFNDDTGQKWFLQRSIGGPGIPGANYRDLPFSAFRMWVGVYLDRRQAAGSRQVFWGKIVGSQIMSMKWPPRRYQDNAGTFRLSPPPKLRVMLCGGGVLNYAENA